jgi:pimeloyl-ACP methyl ester carboxylesterase
MNDAPTQLTAPNQVIGGRSGIDFAYRRFGNAETAALPLIFFQHFRGNIDNWDPLLVDTIAQEREVILVDNAGVGNSSGRVPSTVEAMAEDVTTFVDALNLKRYDVFGFSLGGFVAQRVALIRPHQVRRLVLAGTGPQGGKDMHVYRGELLEAAIRDEQGPEDVLTLFFERTEGSKELGGQYIARIFSRTEDRDAVPDLAARDAQLTAIFTWGIADETRLPTLAGITQPTLVANGDNDLMVPTENTHLLARHLPNAKLSIYPDTGHGFLFQYPQEFATEVNRFLGT